MLNTAIDELRSRLNTTPINSIRFISLKSFIGMVELNLPNLNNTNAINWVRENLCFGYGYQPNHHVHIVKNNNNGAIELAQITLNLLLVTMSNNPIRFYTEGFNNYGFIIEELEDFFKIKGIDLTFNSDDQLNSISEKDKDNENAKLKNEVERLKKENAALKKELSEKDIGAKLRLGEFMENDPAKLVIDVRANWWGDYDPIKDNRPKQDSIIKHLEGKGVSLTMARKIEAVACPINRKK